MSRLRRLADWLDGNAFTIALVWVLGIGLFLFFAIRWPR